MASVFEKGFKDYENVLRAIVAECRSIGMLITLGKYPGRAFVEGASFVLDCLWPPAALSNLYGLATGTGGFTSRQRFSGKLKQLEHTIEEFPEDGRKTLLKSFAAAAAMTFEAEFVLDRSTYRDFSEGEETYLRKQLQIAAEKAGMSAQEQNDLLADVFERYTEPGTYWDKLNHQTEDLRRHICPL